MELGEQIEIRLADAQDEPTVRAVRIRGSVVRVEELPELLAATGGDGGREPADRYEIGVAFDLDWGDGTDDLLEFLEQVQTRRVGRRS
jgi:hypothetical protein